MLVPPDGVNHVVVAGLAAKAADGRSASGIHFSVERGEKEVLQDGLIEKGVYVLDVARRETLKERCKRPLVENGVGDKPLLFDEPAKDEPG